jgi:secreted Zn-dependent insulinase-like peptidase
MIQDMTKADTRLAARSARYLSELEDGFVAFDRRDQVVAQLRSLSHEDMLALMDQEILSPRARRLVVRSLGHAHRDASTWMPSDEAHVAVMARAEIFERGL